MRYIYGLLKKNCEGSWIDRLFYIGQSVNPVSRSNYHKHDNKDNLIKKRIIDKYDFEVKIIWETNGDKDCNDRERFLIRYFGQLCKNTGQLANILDGADGPQNLTEEQKNKLRDSKLLIPLKEIQSHISNYKNSELNAPNFAKNIKINYMTFLSWLRKYDTEHKSFQHVSEQQIEEIHKLYSKNKSMIEIANEMKISKCTISIILDKIGLRNRKKNTSEEEIIKIIKEFSDSNKSIPKFAKLKNIPTSTMRLWLKKYTVGFKC